MRLILTLLFLFNILLPAEDIRPEKVRLQLQWKYQFQFAGFIVAKERGYYKEVGLDVDILEYDNTNSIQDLLDKKIDYAINNSIIIYQDKKLQDVTLLATYFQRSPLVLITQPEIKSPLDLLGKQLMMSENNRLNSSLSILLEYFNITAENTTFIQPTFDLEDFITKKVDAVTAFRSNEIFDLDQREIPYNIIDPVEHGFSTNAINLFASQEKVEKDPDQIRRFLAASKKGWEYALENIDEVTRLIHKQYRPDLSLENLIYEAEITKVLMLQNLYDIGEINREFVQKTYHQLLNSKRLNKDQSPERLLFDTEADETLSSFTRKEKRWIKAHPVVTYSEVDWKPLSIIEEERMHGIMGDYLDIVSQRTGLTFQYHPSKSWPDVLETFKAKKIDLVPGIGSSLQERALGLVSDAYATYPMVIVTNDQYKHLNDLGELKERTIAVPEHYTSHNFILEHYPDMKLLTTSTIPEALLLVKTGKADAFVGHIAPSLYYISQLGLQGLKVSGEAKFEFEHRYLIQEESPELLSIVNKVFTSLTEQERAAIYAKWVKIRVDHKSDYSLIWKSTGALSFIVLFLLYRQQTFKRYQKSLETLKERMELAITGSDVGLWDWDLINKSIYFSPTWKEMLGYRDEELPNLFSSWRERVHPDDLSALILDIEENLEGKTDFFENTHRLKDKEREWKWVLTRAKTLYDKHGKALRMTGTHTDITAHLKVQDELRKQKDLMAHQAYHDHLTNLPNRLLFGDRLTQSIEKAKRHEEEFALLFIDLDRFKQINDSLGHEVGDQVLQLISKRLNDLIRQIDTLARLGGDEFIIIMEGLSKAQDASLLAQKIIEDLTRPMHIDTHTLYVSSSIGISLYPQDDTDANNLLKFADAAMYRAKDEGRNNFQFYKKEMTEQAFEHVVMEASLRHALQEEEFVVYYQPQVDGRDGSLLGMEALVRWQHPSMGIVPPSKFLPLAEETGLIIALDQWVMRHAMKQVIQWHEEGYRPGKLALNLSMKQLQQKDFVKILKSTFTEIGFKPQWLELEVTEGQIMSDPDETITVLEEISALGIGLAIDDFGTGYSSLSYLKRLPIDKLKIDQSFVKDLPEDEDDVAITKAVIALAQSMNLNVLAEGVETEEQKEFLIRHGCDDVQGYLLGRPIDADEFETTFFS